jgi:hypothetical protein
VNTRHKGAGSYLEYSNGKQNLPVGYEKIKEHNAQNDDNRYKGIVLFAREPGQKPEKEKLQDSEKSIGIKKQGGHDKKIRDTQRPGAEKPFVCFSPHGTELFQQFHRNLTASCAGRTTGNGG